MATKVWEQSDQKWKKQCISPSGWAAISPKRMRRVAMPRWLKYRGAQSLPSVVVKQVLLQDRDVAALREQLEQQPYLSLSDRIIVEALAQSQEVARAQKGIAAGREDVKR